MTPEPSWKYVRSREDFWNSLHICKEYCASDRFPIRYFADYFIDCLTVIEAWCADGRTPNYCERRDVRMGLVIFREFDEAGIRREGEWREMAKRITEVGKYFEYWPTDEQIRNDTGFMTSQSMLSPRVPTLDEVKAGALAIENELRRAGRWSSQPLPPEKLEFERPYGADTMTPTEWLQFVFLPKVERCVAGTSPLPTGSGLTQLGFRLAKDRANWPLMHALSDFDQLFYDSPFIDNVMRWPPILKKNASTT